MLSLSHCLPLSMILVSRVSRNPSRQEVQQKYAPCNDTRIEIAPCTVALSIVIHGNQQEHGRLRSRMLLSQLAVERKAEK